MSNPHTLAVETDTAIGNLYGEVASIEQKMGWAADTLRSTAGQYRDYSQRRQMWYVSRKDRTPARLDDAIATCRQLLVGTEDDEYGYGRCGAGGTSVRQVRDALANWTTLQDEHVEAFRKINELQKVWADNGRWNRFFLVTSSAGHIHSSMDCSTCRPTTQFAWLPTVSGLTHVEAVEAHGPTLCSVCFPSAPVEWTLTNAQAKRAAKEANAS